MTRQEEVKDMLSTLKKVVDLISQSQFKPESFNTVITTLGFLGALAHSIEQEIT